MRSAASILLRLLNDRCPVNLLGLIGHLELCLTSNLEDKVLMNVCLPALVTIHRRSVEFVEARLVSLEVGILYDIRQQFDLTNKSRTYDLQYYKK